MKIQRVLASLLFLLLPIVALADGMVVPPTAFPAHVDIPDQQALIHFTNGTERLVIETRFTGAGTNFAWVVPLPSQPVVEAATAGVFPTLQYLFQPAIQHYVTRYYIGLLLLQCRTGDSTLCQRRLGVRGCQNPPRPGRAADQQSPPALVHF